MTTTLIIGNGVGMALDPEYFMLNAGINDSWKTFTPEQQKIISLGLLRPPSKKYELEKHHLIATACQELKNNETMDLSWLTDEGRNFTLLYKEFIYRTAKHFFTYEKELPLNFIDNLISFITKNTNKELNQRCHIATLNYDKLLYKPLVEKKILKGYSGYLVDGVYDSGFSPENLIPTKNHFGWYLHLHGSPVFKTENGEIHKCNINSLPQVAIDQHTAHDHLVLGSSSSKPDMISRSSLLEAYFSFFINALSESTRLYLVGYSGLDNHVNLEIKKWATPEKKIFVIEWQESKTTSDFWKKNLLPDTYINNNIINIHRLANILEYNFD